MEKIERRNYKSDFDAIIRLKDCRGNIVPFPDCDWEAVFWTSNRAVVYKASRRGGVYVNCFNDNGQIHVVFKHHRLSSGILKWEPHFELPNSIYPDGIQDLYEPEQLAIELVLGRGDCPATTDIEAMLPYIKFKYENLTDAEKAELQQPATEAAQKLDAFVGKAEKSEAQRVADEALRIEAEKARASQEAARERAEATRQANEEERISAESQREEAETEREGAETARAEEFATWQHEINSKADRSELSNVIAQEPLTPGNFPGINTYTREKLKMDLFIDMWNQAWGKYGKYDPENAPDPEHPFMGNKLWMTYEEAMEIYQLSAGWNSAYSDYGPHVKSAANKLFTGVRVRTLIPAIKGNAWMFMHNLFSLSEIEVIRLVQSDNIIPIDSPYHTFYNCKKLREVLTQIDYVSSTSMFAGCINLEEVRLRLNGDMDLSDSPKLSLYSIQYMSGQSLNGTTPITITLHPDAYARVTEDIFALAVSKNITIASV